MQRRRAIVEVDPSLSPVDQTRQSLATSYHTQPLPQLQKLARG